MFCEHIQETVGRCRFQMFRALAFVGCFLAIISHPAECRADPPLELIFRIVDRMVGNAAIIILCTKYIMIFAARLKTEFRWRSTMRPTSPKIT